MSFSVVCDRSVHRLWKAENQASRGEKPLTQPERALCMGGECIVREATAANIDVYEPGTKCAACNQSHSSCPQVFERVHLKYTRPSSV